MVEGIYGKIRALLQDNAPEVKGAVVMLHTDAGMVVHLLTCVEDDDKDAHVEEANTLVACAPTVIERWYTQIVEGASDGSEA